MAEISPFLAGHKSGLACICPMSMCVPCVKYERKRATHVGEMGCHGRTDVDRRTDGRTDRQTDGTQTISIFGRDIKAPVGRAKISNQVVNSGTNRVTKVVDANNVLEITSERDNEWVSAVANCGGKKTRYITFHILLNLNGLIFVLTPQNFTKMAEISPFLAGHKSGLACICPMSCVCLV